VKFMQGDKISFLLVASGNFSLSDIHVDYTGRDSKQVNNWQSQEKRARGSELLSQTRFGDTGNCFMESHWKCAALCPGGRESSGRMHKSCGG
jgi:hypothetical protein